MTREVDPLLERIDRDLEECVAATLPPQIDIVSTTPESANAVLDQVAAWGRRLDELPKPPSEIKLTSGEWEMVKAHAPQRSPSQYGAILGDPFGIPVRLVDNPEESTLYRPPYVGFDEPPEPQPERMRGWLARWLERWSR